jgi:hypothetical protein
MKDKNASLLTSNTSVKQHQQNEKERRDVNNPTLNKMQNTMQDY